MSAVEQPVWMEVLKKYPRAIVCTVLSVVLAIVIYVRSGLIPQMDKTYQENSLKLDVILRNQAQGGELGDDLNELKRLVAGMEDRLMVVEDKAKNYQFFYDIETKSRATVNSITQTTVTQGDGSLRPKLEQFTAIGFQLNVRGGVMPLMSFLKRVESGKYFVRFSSVTLKGNSTVIPDGVEAVLNLEVLAKKP